MLRASYKQTTSQLQAQLLAGYIEVEVVSRREKNFPHPPTSRTQTLRARAANRGGWVG